MACVQSETAMIKKFYASAFSPEYKIELCSIHRKYVTRAMCFEMFGNRFGFNMILYCTRSVKPCLKQQEETASKAVKRGLCCNPNVTDICLIFIILQPNGGYLIGSMDHICTSSSDWSDITSFANSFLILTWFDRLETFFSLSFFLCRNLIQPCG